MGIRVIVSKVYLYTILSVFVYTFFHLVVFTDNFFFEGIYDPRALASGALFAILFSIIFLPLLNKVQKSSDVLFYKGYNPREILKELSIKMGSVIKLEHVKKIIAEEFKKILATDEVDVIVFPSVTDVANKANVANKKKEIINKPEENFGKAVFFKNACDNRKSLIYQAVVKTKKIIIEEELKDKETKSLVYEMRRHHIEIIAPLMLRSEIVGVILVGEKISQDAYTKEDIEFLEVISSQAAVAIENARLYKEIEDFNRMLKKKVDEQTKEIVEKAEHLQKLLAMRSEFLDITSHQLRTPVSVIKGVLSMLPDKRLTPDKKAMLIDAAWKKSLKLEEIIDEILRASEMDTDVFELNLKPTDITSTLQEIWEDKKGEAADKKLELILDLPKEPLPMIMTEERYLKHAIGNLVNNSIQYTLKGHIKMAPKAEGDFLVIRVSDTGIGIPDKDRGKLFKKFSRAKNAVETYTDGSGLGLFIIKKIMAAHPGGKVEIEKTEIDKGTTFALYIPLATDKDKKLYAKQQQAKK